MTRLPLSCAALLLLACTGSTTDSKSTTDSSDTDTDTDSDTDADTDTDSDTDADTDTDTTTVTVPDPTGDPATIPLGGECPLETKQGSFGVEHYEEYSLVSGSMADSVNPVTVLEPMATEGDCKLLRKNYPFCDPACGAGTVCDFDGTCIPFPANQDVGTVTIGGTLVDFVLHPTELGSMYFQTRDVPHPAAEAGELVELRTLGTTYGSDIVLHGVGVEPIGLEGEDQWTVVEGQPLTITWNPAGDSLQTRVAVSVNIDQHGTTPVTLFCNFPDTGTADIPSALLDQLINFGVTGFPNGTIARQTADSTTMGDGCVQFLVRSQLVPTVRVDGYIPCNGPADCDYPQICDPVTFICHDP